MASLLVNILTLQANAEFEEEQNISVTGSLVAQGGFIVPVGQASVQFGETSRDLLETACEGTHVPSNLPSFAR